MTSQKNRGTPSADIYSVTRLNREARAVLEGSFPVIWVQGEISNLAQPASGHIYFSLKDEYSQVRCALFQTRKRELRDRKSTRLNSSHMSESRMPSSA